MCDTIVAPPHSTAAHALLFGKNSDRQRNEAQTVECFRGADHGAGAQLNCTYIAIPQVRRTHAVILCRPFWTWGAEMGANEYGVVVGNEGLHARNSIPQEKALIGMDLLRLALERSTTAEQAVETIATLLERYGQGGNCGHLTPAYYHNGFLIADATGAYVLETLGKEWLVERVGGVRAISNRYSIHHGAQRVSAGLEEVLRRDSGWDAAAGSSYADAIADPQREHIGNAGARHACSTSLLRLRDGQLRVGDMMSILRDHGSGDRYRPEWHGDCVVRRTVCMHAGAEERPGQTVGSMVSQLHPHDAVHWVTGTAAPCISIFKPVLLDVPLPAHGPVPTDRYDPNALWWRHERMHRAAAQGDFAKFLDDIRQQRDALEAEFHARLAAVVNGGSASERSQVVAACWHDAIAMEHRWSEQVSILPAAADAPDVAAWERLNQLAGLEA